MITTRSAVFYVLLVALCALPTFAQVAPGFPPHSTTVGGPDQIDPANLNIHITVPILKKAGRQMPFVYNLTYNSTIWVPVMVGYTGTWEPATNVSVNSAWGWSNGNAAALGGTIQYSQIVGTCYGYDQYGYPYADATNVQYFDFVFVDGAGTPHPFTTTLGTWAQFGGDSQCPDYNYNDTTPGQSYLATDGSGYAMLGWASGYTYGNVVSPSGTIMDMSSFIQDSNGNEITYSYYAPTSSFDFTDTLGNTALSVSYGATPTTYTYTAPSGANAVYKEQFTTYNIRTNFGCPGIGEYSTSNARLVTEIDLPDQAVNTNDKYTFTYEDTPGYPGYKTGRIKSVTFPRGGTIIYAYSGGYNGINCADGSPAILTRQTPDTGSNYWTYVHSVSGTAGVTTITDPQGNQTVMNFQQALPTETQIYSGTSSSGTLLKTIYSCYNGSTPNCNSTSVTLPISSKAVYVQWPGGLESKTVTSYNSYDLVTEKDEYGYGSGSPGSLVRKRLTTYNTTLSNNIVNKPSQVTVEDGSGNVKAETTYSYDGSGVSATSGTPQHVSISGSRGNATTISTLVSGSTFLTKYFSYYDTGNINQVTDVNSAVTTYAYGSGSCGNSFPTSITEPVGSMTESMTWSCTGNVLTAAADENSNTGYATYSSNAYYWIPDSSQDQLGYVTNYTFGPSSTEGSLLFNGSSSTVDRLVTSDALGRTLVSQSKEGPSSGTYDSVEYGYDSLGRPDFTSLPYSTTTIGGTSSSAPGTSTTYDPLGRPTGVSDSGGLSESFSYNQNDTFKTVGPAPSGENTKKKQYEYDALGRLTSVCEVTGGIGSGTCSQTSSQTGYWTEYAYDANNNLVGATQNAQASGTYQQSRTYTYDDLGRMTSETNPESGFTVYSYDTDSTCGTSYGDLVKAADAVGNVICFSYDALHRMTSTTYPSGGYASVTPSRYFVYDSATVNSVSMSNAKGRLAEAYTCTSCPSTKITDIGISYDADGDRTDTYESTPHSGGYNHISAAYWANGVIKQLNGLSGLPTISYGVDSKGRGNTVSASSGQNPVTTTGYNVADEITGITFGSSDYDSFTYDSNTDRMTQYGFNINGTAATGTLSWNSNGTLGGLAVVDGLYSGGTQTCSFGHDDLVRITSANCGSVFSQTFSFDAFGNIDKSGSYSFGPSYSPTTNRITSIGACTPSYDSDGNATNDCVHSFGWDSNGDAVTVDSVGATYDALGRMVEQNNSGTYTEIVYDPNGGKLALMNGSTLQKAYVQLPDGAAAVYNSSGLQYYRHSDWIGSSRLASTPSRTLYFDGSYAPYGESYAATGASDLSFTGMNQDAVSTIYDFPNREYEIQGRWPSPDPAGTASADPTDPQSWNRYAYVRNNPLALVDPTGEDCDEANTWVTDASCDADWSFCPSCYGLGFEPGSGGSGPGTPGPGWCDGLPSNAEGCQTQPTCFDDTANLPYDAGNQIINCGPAPPEQQNCIFVLQNPCPNGSGGGGSGSSTSKGGTSSPQTVEQHCLNAYYGSKSGTAVDFGSLGGLVPGWSPNATANFKEIATLGVAKYAGLKGMQKAGSAFDTMEILSITGKTVTIPSAGSAGLGVISKVLGRVALIATTVATAVDISAHYSCWAEANPDAATALENMEQ